MSKAISSVRVYSTTSSSSMREIENCEDNPLSSTNSKYYSSASYSSSSSNLPNVPRMIPRTTSTHEDFQEDDVWSVVEDYSSSPNKYYISSSASSKKKSSSPSSACVPIKTPKIASTHEASSGKMVQKSSVPVEVPDWSKIYGRNARNMGSWTDDHDHGSGYHDKYHYNNNNDHVNGDGEGEGDGDDMLPPHEWLARRLARSQICASSVYEGIGRKLKGRDLTNVRQAVLTKTGFIEQ